MTVNELIELLNNIDDKDKDIYVNVHGREYWISKIDYSDCNEVCFKIKEDFYVEKINHAVIFVYI